MHLVHTQAIYGQVSVGKGGGVHGHQLKPENRRFLPLKLFTECDLHLRTEHCRKELDSKSETC